MSLMGRGRGRLDNGILESVYRFRGILLVVSVPLLLILTIAFVMPRSAKLGDTVAGSEFEPLDRSSLEVSGTDLSSEAPGDKYAVVIDCGSTGSRIHVYKFNEKLELKEIGKELELFISVKPGLSSYKDDPKKGGESLKKLLDAALNVVPDSVRMATPVRVGATAGLRLLPGDLADKLLDEVRSVLNEYPFSFAHDSVKILDGADEGSFAWVTVNFLLGSLGSPSISGTVAVIDLGGGSVQMTYAIDEDNAKKAPEGYVRKLSALGQTYNVYVHSYLGYGLMAGRAQVLKQQKEGEGGHACILKGVQDKYKYGDDELPAVSRPEGGSFDDCSSLTSSALSLDSPCEFDQCSFSGVWSGGKGEGSKHIYVASYFFDRAGQFNVIPDASVSSVEVKPVQFQERAENVCSLSLAEIASLFPSVEERDAAYGCLDVTYQYILLTKGFGIPPQESVTLVKQIAYKGKEVEAAWPLGAAIDALSSSPSTSAEV